jgi:hypothetical protein
MRSLAVKICLAALLGLILAAPANSQMEYRDNESGVSLTLPPGWTWTSPPTERDEETSFEVFRDAGSGVELKLYVHRIVPAEEVTPAEKMNRRLLKQAEAKVRQRTREGYENYRLRESSLKLRTINGRTGLTWVADYDDHGRNMVEYFTRVRSENTNAVFFERMAPEQLKDFKARVDPIIETLQIP